MSSATIPRNRPSTSSPPSHQPSQSRQHHRAASDTSSLLGYPPPPQGPQDRPQSNTSPFTFIRPFQPNPSSTSLAPSNAEGKPIPVDDSTVENRTSALRQLNSNYPSRHRYERSTGAQSSTYSEPVIVRSYYSPFPARPISTSRRGVVVHGGEGTVSQTGTSAKAERRIFPFAATVVTAKNGMLTRIGRGFDGQSASGKGHDGAKLPPVEAFTFKSFMSNMEEQGSSSDINADLDRIAEICAKSRYSLSNQYEVHYSPHGSGSSFFSPSNVQDYQGPTLQIVSSDDERNMRRRRRRRDGTRRNSRAMGTLETIISSSRSSDEDRSKKKSADELADEVRGRAARKSSSETSPTIASGTGSDNGHLQGDHTMPKASPGRRSASLALIDSSKQIHAPGSSTPPRASSTTLVGEPALPKASTSQLEIRTAPDGALKTEDLRTHTTSHRRNASLNIPFLQGNGLHPSEPGGKLISALSGWIPWRSSDLDNRSAARAEGSLRELLRSTDVKGKGIEIPS